MKAGYTAIIGNPNVGKSTLMNALVGEKLSIVTPKPQTTRKRVLGIYSSEDSQIIFFDTPGILEPRYGLHQSMMNFVAQSLEEADIILVMLDVSELTNDKINDSDKILNLYLEKIKSLNKPVILALNKIDQLKNVKEVLPLIAHYSKTGFYKEIVPVSALKKASTALLLEQLIKYLPVNEFFYDSEQLSTLSERFFVSEIIRENIYLEFKEEIPYSAEVQIVQFKERERGKWLISAEIIVERDSQKAIVIGDKGSKIKYLGEKSRLEIERHLEMPVFLDLFVKVRPKWRDNTNMLQSFGY